MEAHENRPKNSVGSSRIRVTWLLNYWPEAEAFKIGPKYDVVIFQKAYFTRYMKAFDGIKILDICDPDWLEGKPVMETIGFCDAVVTSSKGLYDYLSQVTEKPVLWIDDRVDLNLHTQRKEHVGKAQGVVWFGYNNNFSVVDGTIATLHRLGLKLTVISDMPYHPGSKIHGVDDGWIKANIKNVKFDPEFINEEIINGGDIVLNPRPETGKFKFKSNNKTIIAWALGMPVALDSNDLGRFLSEEERKKEAELRLKNVEENYDVKISVSQYKELIAKIQNGKQV